MPTVTQIREAIGAQLATISGLNVHAVVVGSIVPPAAVVTPATSGFLRYTTSQSGTNDYTFTITLFVSRADETSGQQAIDPYIDPTGASSIYAAVTGTLGGLVDDAFVSGIGRYGPISYAGIDLLACEFTVSVMA